MIFRKFLYISLLTINFSSYSFALSFSTIFDSVAPEHKGVFENEGQRLFKDNLAQLRDLQKGKVLKTVFIVHDLWKSNDPVIQEKRGILEKIDLHLKLAGIRSLLDLVDGRAGGLSIHQFFNQIFQEESNLIIIESGGWSDGSHHSRYIASNAIAAQQKKTEPPVFIKLGNVDPSGTFSAVFASHFVGSESVQFHLENSKLSLCELMSKTYELIHFVFKQDPKMGIIQLKEELASSLESLAKNTDRLEELLRKQKEKEKTVLEDLAKILGI
jgi:hypothetical protein